MAKYHSDTVKEILSQRAKEVVFVNRKYQALNNIEKTIIVNNIVFDDARFINTLNKGNFSYDSLDSFLK